MLLASAGCTLFTPLSDLSGGSPDIVRIDAGDEAPARASSSLFDAFTGNPADDDPRSIEVGVRFVADVPGVVTAIRFHRGTFNEGPHIGTLWGPDGSVLGSVAFPTAAGVGWQIGVLTTPVEIEAGTPYVASYHAPRGRYSSSQDFFVRAYAAPPLRVDVAGGIFVYADFPRLPTQSYRSSNYWVDVVFQAR